MNEYEPDSLTLYGDKDRKNAGCDTYYTDETRPIYTTEELEIAAMVSVGQISQDEAIEMLDAIAARS